jgi:hypothetical protein
MTTRTGGPGGPPRIRGCTYLERSPTSPCRSRTTSTAVSTPPDRRREFVEPGICDSVQSGEDRETLGGGSQTRSLFVLPLLLSLSTAVAGEAPLAGEAPSAQEILAEYLAGPCPDQVMDSQRRRRMEILRPLWDRVDEGVPAVAEVLPGVDCRVHRLELVELLGRMPSRASADLLIPYLQDPDVTVRWYALIGLRLQASRILRAGVVDVPKGPEFPPQVEGLLPHLVAAAHDEDAGIRSLALYALTDSRDPVAVDELRRALDDPDRHVRFSAACLLTEFDDASGLPELRATLDRLMGSSAGAAEGKLPDRYIAAEHLIVSFERITGESLGRIPPIPLILSSLAAQEKSRLDYEALLLAWDHWWRVRDGER